MSAERSGEKARKKKLPRSGRSFVDKSTDIPDAALNTSSVDVDRLLAELNSLVGSDTPKVPERRKDFRS